MRALKERSERNKNTQWNMSLPVKADPVYQDQRN